GRGVALADLLAQHVERDLGELRTRHRSAGRLVQALLDDLGHVERARRRQAGGHDARRHQTLGVGKLVLLVADDDVALRGLGHLSFACSRFLRTARSATSVASSSKGPSPPTVTTRLSQNTTSIPRSRASPVARSIAAALSSTTRTSASSAASRSAARSGRFARWLEEPTTLPPCSCSR